MKLAPADELVRYLAYTANEQHEQSSLLGDASHSLLDDPDMLQQRMMLAYGYTNLPDDTLPDQDSFQACLEAMAQQSSKWLSQDGDADAEDAEAEAEEEEADTLANRGFMGPLHNGDDPVFQSLLADALAISDRFVPEPYFARTGTGYLKSAGVAEVQEAKKKARS